MPIYEYECSQCGHQLEAIQKISDHPLVTCPECQHDHLKKLVSASKFVLKGQGWYETDFKHNNKPKPSEQAEQKTEQKAPDHQDTASSSTASDSAGSAKDVTKKEEHTASPGKKTDTTKSTEKKST